jgi:hypothetical protein
LLFEAIESQLALDLIDRQARFDLRRNAQASGDELKLTQGNASIEVDESVTKETVLLRRSVKCHRQHYRGIR